MRLRFLTAFYGGDDKLQHPVVATSSGDIFGISFKPGKFQMTGSLANVANMVAFSGFYAGDNHMRTLVAGTAGETIQEITFDSKKTQIRKHDRHVMDDAQVRRFV